MISVYKATVSIHPWDPEKFSVYWLYFPVAYHFSDVPCSFLMGFHLTPAKLIGLILFKGVGQDHKLQESYSPSKLGADLPN